MRCLRSTTASARPRIWFLTWSNYLVLRRWSMCCRQERPSVWLTGVATTDSAIRHRPRSWSIRPASRQVRQNGSSAMAMPPKRLLTPMRRGQMGVCRPARPITCSEPPSRSLTSTQRLKKGWWRLSKGSTPWTPPKRSNTGDKQWTDPPRSTRKSNWGAAGCRHLGSRVECSRSTDG